MNIPIPIHCDGESKALHVHPSTTERALIRRAKSAFNLSHLRHLGHEGVGPDGGRYIYLRIVGTTLNILIELNTINEEEEA